MMNLYLNGSVCTYPVLTGVQSAFTMKIKDTKGRTMLIWAHLRLIIISYFTECRRIPLLGSFRFKCFFKGG